VLAYAIGDIHGRVDLLEVILSAVETDFARSEAARKILIFLGDYVDRGPSSKQVLDRLTGRLPADTHFLGGNHEQTFLQFVSDAAVGPTWGEFGGRDTLRSYDVSPPLGRGDTAGWEAARLALLAHLPAAHLEFLRNLESSFTLGDYFFSHAGARPGVELDSQAPEDLLWIRNEFLNDSRRFSHVIVHGHTPSPEVYADERRIGLDTGAFATHVLTALRLEGKRRTFIQTIRAPDGSLTLATPRGA